MVWLLVLFDKSKECSKKQKSPLEIFQRDVLASQEGFEPPTVRLEGECSIQLSYYDRSLTTELIVSDFEITCKAFSRKNLNLDNSLSVE